MSSIANASESPSRSAVWVAVLAVGVLVVLAAQFILDSWADSNEALHWLQHALLFWGGVMTGAGALRLFQIGGRPA